MTKLLLIYIAIAIILFTRNKFLYFKCNYLMNSLNTNNAYKYMIPINDILQKAHTYSLEASNPKNYLRQNNFDDIRSSLLIAQGVFYTNYIRSPFWLYYLLSRLSIFKPIQRHIPNKFFSFILYLVEWFVLYLLGVYLDKADIGGKLLDLIREKLNLLTSIVQKLS